MRILSIFALSALALTATAQSYTIKGIADDKAENERAGDGKPDFSCLWNNKERGRANDPYPADVCKEGNALH